MINLIPQEEKKKIIKGFYYKLIVLFLAIMGASFLFAFIAILPSYFLSSVKDSIANDKLETQKKEPVPMPEVETLAVIKDLNNKLTLIEKAESNKFIISKQVIDVIFSKKLPDIKITAISYENDSNDNLLSNKKITIEGTAPSREMLLLFRQALEADSAFQHVDLPISNFVKGSNIQFYLSLIPSNINAK